jgi:hypothetical protein
VDRLHNDSTRSNLGHGSDYGRLGRDSGGAVVANMGKGGSAIVGLAEDGQSSAPMIGS